MKRIVAALNHLTRALYGEELDSNAIASILDNGKENAIKLVNELKLALEEEDSIVH